jgi:beta-glucosidase
VNPIDWVTGQIVAQDAVVLAMGISNKLEGEEGESMLSPYKGDRKDITLPEVQMDFIRKLRSQDSITPIILVLTGGSPISIEPVEHLVDAVLFAWYPGEQGGNAIADVLFGDATPSGKLPLTFPKSVEQLPPYEDYSMEGRTYRYMKKEPLYPFGFGLSYTSFEYNDLILSKENIKRGEKITATAKITNTGKLPGEEVVQLYITDVESSTRAPLFSMKGFQRVMLEPGESKEIKFEILPDMMQIFDDEGIGFIEPGEFKISIGGSLPTERSKELGAPSWVEKSIWVK